jgi:hypothetical protein
VAAVATLWVLVPRAPSPGHGQARPESRPTGDHEVAADAADDDAPPRWGQMLVQPASAPERLQGVLVMRECSCVMSGCPRHDAGASTSHAAPPAPDAAVAHPEHRLRYAGAPPAHFDEAQAEQALWQEFRDYGASINNALTEALRVHGGPLFWIF